MMEPLSSTARTQNLQRMANERFDVLVIGGGVTGAGVALDAVARGYRVALVEKADFASGTSSKSTKLVHGGIRYLPNFDFGLVREALIERGLLLQNAPFLVHPVPFVLPMYEGDKHPVGMPFTPPGGIGLNFMLNVGLWMYDTMAGRRNIHRHRHISREAVLQYAPTLVQKGLKDGFVYYDAQTNDARLTLTLLRTAARYGATIANYTEVTSFLLEEGKVSGAQVCDRLGNEQFAIQARYVVNATGIFAEQVEELTGTQPLVKIEPSKGVHLVLDNKDIQLGDAAVVLPETEDRRILFLVPWQSRIIFGTTDTGSGDLNHPTASSEDISYLLKYLNRYLTTSFTEADIVSIYAGYRPLVESRTSAHSTAKLSRTHAVLQNASGLVSIVGGKLTTYRRMAQDTVDVLNRRDGVKPVHPTQNLPLQGSAGWPKMELELTRKGEALGLAADVLKHLGDFYGSEAVTILDYIEQDANLAKRLVADLPYIQAEVIYACRHEMAMTPYDVLARRTSIVLEDKQQGRECVDTVAALMTQEYHWSQEQSQSLIDAYRNTIQTQLVPFQRA